MRIDSRAEQAVDGQRQLRKNCVMKPEVLSPLCVQLLVRRSKRKYLIGSSAAPQPNLKRLSPSSPREVRPR